MTNKKMTTPYANGEGLAALPYGNTALAALSLLALAHVSRDTCLLSVERSWMEADADGRSHVQP